MATLKRRRGEISRKGEGRRQKQPDLFLSHSSRDKTAVRKLAEDLTFCQVDVWFDEWELQVGDSLHDSIGSALEKSRYVGVILGDNFSDSRWAHDELKQALSRERRSDTVNVLPLLFGNCVLPAFMEDKIYIDFRKDYYVGLLRLAGAVHGVSGLRIEEATRSLSPSELSAVIGALRYCGIEPYIVLGEDDFKEIAAVAGTEVLGDRVRFDPQLINKSNVSLRIRNLMHKLVHEVWASPKYISATSPVATLNLSIKNVAILVIPYTCNGYLYIESRINPPKGQTKDGEQLAICSLSRLYFFS